MARGHSHSHSPAWFLSGLARPVSTFLPATIASFGDTGRWVREGVADEAPCQLRASIGALAQCIEQAVSARRTRSDTAAITCCAAALVQGVRQHQLFLTGLDSAWHLLYAFGAYQNALHALCRAAQDWHLALERRSPGEGACFDRLELLAWRMVGEGLLLIDMYGQGSGPLSEAPLVPAGRGVAPWLRLRAWWQRRR